jgi:hypothetical protein
VVALREVLNLEDSAFNASVSPALRVECGVGGFLISKVEGTSPLPRAQNCKNRVTWYSFLVSISGDSIAMGLLGEARAPVHA